MTKDDVFVNQKHHLRDFIMARSLAGLLVTLAGLGCLSGCGTPGNSASDGTSSANRKTGTGYTIATTTGMVADIVRNVAGEKAEVICLMGEGTDPHGYEPTRSDIKQLHGADVVFYSGLILEARMTEVFQQMAAEGKPCYAVTASFDKAELIYPTAHPDPHVWMDASMWSKSVGEVAEKLARYDAANAAFYRANAKKYQADLERLDAYAKEVIATIPDEQRMLITAHDAFSYFSRRYQIKVQAPQGVDTTQEASIADINRLVGVIVDRKIKAIFTEDSVNDKNLNAILSGAAARGWTVKKAAKKLFSDSMGPAGTYEGTYVGMIDHNATVIARELGGNAPEGGLNGKLSAGP
jgi:manganese/zinc/iron transport system substrate-binding protein